MSITLKAARVNKDLSQKEAAKLLGISIDTLINYEKGRTFPDIRILRNIEKLYDVTYEDIIFLQDMSE